MTGAARRVLALRTIKPCLPRNVTATRAFARQTKLLLAVVMGLAASACRTLHCQTGPANDVVAVKQVVERLRVAIVERDKPAYMALFFSDKPEEIGWQAVVDDERLRSIQANRPQAFKARRIPTNHFVALIDGVVSSTAAEEERISNVCVTTDGEVASAVFDYAYVSAGQATNRGSEHWQLVRTEGGWKIYSVIYTIRKP